MALSLNQTYAPFVRYIPFITPPQAWISSRMLDASQEALRISIEHLMIQRTKFLGSQDAVVSAIDRLKEAVLSACAPVLMEIKEPGQSRDAGNRRCHRLVQRVEALQSDMAICAYQASDISAKLDEAEYAHAEVSLKTHSYDMERVSIGAYVIPAIQEELTVFTEVAVHLRDHTTLDALSQYVSRIFVTPY